MNQKPETRNQKRSGVKDLPRPAATSESGPTGPESSATTTIGALPAPGQFAEVGTDGPIGPRRNEAIAPYPANAAPLTLERLDAMPAGPVRSIKEMTLPELEAASRGLRDMPERLEGLSGIAGVLNGLVLVEIKSRMTHGEWQPWLKVNYGKTSRTARRCMQLAKEFTKTDTVSVFGEQLTLALLDDTQAQSLDMGHPMVKRVTKWTDGRSFRALIADVGDGRKENRGGFIPNLVYLRGWLRDNYSDNETLESGPDGRGWMDMQFFELPEEIQARYKSEGKRYEERLPKAAKEELEMAQASRDWNASAAKVLHDWMDAGYFRRGNLEQKRANVTALADLLQATKEDLRESEAKLTAKSAQTTKKALRSQAADTAASTRDQALGESSAVENQKPSRKAGLNQKPA